MYQFITFAPFCPYAGGQNPAFCACLSGFWPLLSFILVFLTNFILAARRFLFYTILLYKGGRFFAPLVCERSTGL